MSEAPDYLERLVRFVATTPYEAIPAAVLARTKEILVDTLPVIATGMRAPELVALSARQIDSSASGRAWVIGSGRTCNPLGAAVKRAGIVPE